LKNLIFKEKKVVDLKDLMIFKQSIKIFLSLILLIE